MIKIEQLYFLFICNTFVFICNYKKLLRKALDEEREYIKDKKIVDSWSKGVKKWRANELQVRD